MQLLSGEAIVVPAAGGFPTLTSHRLWFESSDGSEQQIRVIFLEDLCYASVMHQEKPFWLGLAIIAALGGLFAGLANTREMATYVILGAIVAVVCWLIYKGSKKQFLTLSAASGKIAVELHGDSLARSTAFIESVIGVKNERYLVGKTPDIKVQRTGA
jgi:hypothetical protein